MRGAPRRDPHSRWDTAGAVPRGAKTEDVVEIGAPEGQAWLGEHLCPLAGPWCGYRPGPTRPQPEMWHQNAAPVSPGAGIGEERVAFWQVLSPKTSPGEEQQGCGGIFKAGRFCGVGVNPCRVRSVGSTIPQIQAGRGRSFLERQSERREPGRKAGMCSSPSRWESPGQSIPPAGPGSCRLFPALRAPPGWIFHGAHGIGAHPPGGHHREGFPQSSVFQQLINPVALSKAKTRARRGSLELILAFAGEILIAWETSPKSPHPTVLLKSSFFFFSL